ncbi:MAG: hypothetical protein PHE25_05210 [Candidatus Gracilibacteria bacterium]|nr:hypothetical protein [Candidatus Gracilibacteria bacterium]
MILKKKIIKSIVFSQTIVTIASIVKLKKTIMTEEEKSNEKYK